VQVYRVPHPLMLFMSPPIFLIYVDLPIFGISRIAENSCFEIDGVHCMAKFILLQ
jgi:hypothetical protein